MKEAFTVIHEESHHNASKVNKKAQTFNTPLLKLYYVEYILRDLLELQFLTCI